MSPLKDLIVRKHLAVQTSAHEPLIDNYKRVEYCMQVVEWAFVMRKVFDQDTRVLIEDL